MAAVQGSAIRSKTRPAGANTRPGAPRRLPATGVATRPLADTVRTGAQARLAATAAMAPAARQVPAEERDGGFWDGLESVAKAVGGAVAGAAKAVGNAVAGAARAVGGAVVGAAKAVGGAVAGAGRALWSWTKTTADNVYTWGVRQAGKVATFFGANLIQRDSGTLWTRRIERDPGDVNVTGPLGWARAQAYLLTHKAEVGAARARLGEEDRARYDRVLAAAGGDAVAQATLQKLLVAGKLPGGAAPGGDQGSLLAQLDRLATQPVAAGVGRRALVADVIQEVADPVAINQHGKGTCVAAVASILLAKTNPAEYVRLIGGLASPEGRVLTARGDSIARENDWNAGDGGRSVSGRLLQPALMELGNGALDYDNARDKHSNGQSGLTATESERILDSITGREYVTVHVGGKQVAANKLDEAFDRLKAALDRGQRVPVGLYWIQGGHKVLAERVSGGRVYYTNPWGKEESLSVEEFKARLSNFNL